MKPDLVFEAYPFMADYIGTEVHSAAGSFK
jgi:hypothetical protein